MLNLDSINSREDFKWEVIRQAHKDAGFRAALRTDATAAAHKLSAGDYTVALHQERPDSIYFLINYNPDLSAAANNVTVNPSDTPEEVVVKKAWKDPAYRSALLADPEGMLRKEFGSGMPAGVRLIVLDETRNTLQIILPASAAEEASEVTGVGELNEAELEEVSGGGAWDWLAKKLAPYANTSPSTNSGSCGCVSASGVRA